MSRPPEIPDDWGHCLMCGQWFPFEQLTNMHAVSYECLTCAEETERILHDDDWWAKNGPKE
mgnify:CR=1 FL=1